MWRIIVIIYFLFIAVLHLIPSTSLPEVSLSDLFQLDKLVHAFLFAGAFLVLYKYCLQYYIKFSRFILVIICVFYGFLMEFLQALLAQNRNGDIMDFVADTIGVLLGLYLSTKFRTWRLIIKQKD